MTEPTPLPPILTAHLFPKIEGLLIELLQSLSPEDWERQTVSPRWKVKDVAAHLLDTQLRKLSLARDGYFAEQPVINSPSDLAAFINRLNEEGVRQYRRLSPAVLIAMMELASQQSATYHRSLDPFAPAMFGVPASNLYGSALKVVSSKVTERIMSPPPCQGGMASRCSRLPQSTPIPVGPYILWPLNA